METDRSLTIPSVDQGSVTAPVKQPLRSTRRVGGENGGTDDETERESTEVYPSDPPDVDTVDTLDSNAPYLEQCSDGHSLEDRIDRPSESKSTVDSTSSSSASENSSNVPGVHQINLGLHKHITISRDQTAAGDHQKERLLVPRDQHLEPSYEDYKKISFVPEIQRAREHFALAYEQFAREQAALEHAGRQALEGAREQVRSRITDLSPKLVSLSHPNTSMSPFSLNGAEAQSDNTPSKITHLYGNAAEDILTNNSKGDQLEQLMHRIRTLEAENVSLRKGMQPILKNSTLQIFHKIEGNAMTYLGLPSWEIGPEGSYRLKGQTPILDPDRYIRNNGHIAFVVTRFYTERIDETVVKRALREGGFLPPPEHCKEEISLVSNMMRAAFEEYTATLPNFLEDFPNFDVGRPIPAPYLFWYIHRTSSFDRALEPQHVELLKLLTNWIEKNYGDEYSKVQGLFSRGYVSFNAMQYLIRPGDLLISRAKTDIRAYQATSRAVPCKHSSSRRQPISLAYFPYADAVDADEYSWEASVWAYDYIGVFYRKEDTLRINFRVRTMEEEVKVESLSVVPLRFLGEELRAQLETRGKLFWSCRFRRLVSYQDDSAGSMFEHGDRCMVDFSTYKELHSDTFKPSFVQLDKHHKVMSEDIMDQDEPPQDPELLLFPSKIIGYNLRRKKWADLKVDNIKDVSWNKQAFDRLAIDDETKELVQALVTNLISAEKSTDLIENKGNGLLMLLHGGPGTGKTFTAETVAEMAEKPLFQVTCVDIGTKPEKVEKYLEWVLHLGKIWGCVVLLDEADVFLEQRTLADLERNALVSVFLRVLEYYEGILILTSNRVGTFDEAFKSRIQLALHYKALTKAQRIKIWRNFLNRLQSLNEQDIDYDDINCYIGELANKEMNGRQIRNAINTGRQLARFRGSAMSYVHLEHVINVASKFEEYLIGVQDGFSDDHIARGQGIR